jgi:dTMP kinase
VIVPNLEKGVHVICDRFSDSTKAYQQVRGITRDKIDFLIKFATGGLVPDITFLLDIPVEVGLERAKAKSIYKEGDRMEKEDIKFHESVRNNFLKLAESITEQHRFKVIDAAPPKDIETIHKEVVSAISKELWLRGEEL